MPQPRTRLARSGISTTCGASLHHERGAAFRVKTLTITLFFLAFVVGALTTLAGAALVARILRPRLERSEEDARAATDRLVTAWREGALIPPAPEEPAPLEELHPDVAAWLDQWDSTGRPVWEARVRGLMMEGYTGAGIIRRLEVPES